MEVGQPYKSRARLLLASSPTSHEVENVFSILLICKKESNFLCLLVCEMANRQLN